MCVNDVLVQGAEPLFFLDYFACGHLDVDVATDVVKGIADGCKLAGAALVGGETAEMPDMYAAGEYDLAGFCVGAVERARMIDGQSIRAGDALIGLRSSGPHSNGYSLIRKVLELAGSADIDGREASEVLIEPTRIYVKPILNLMEAVEVKGLAHITGGGITENLPRIFASSVHAEIETASWEQGPVFDWLASAGNITTEEMRRTFNCGVGMIAVVKEEDASEAIDVLADNGEQAWVIGRIADGAGEVKFL
jgi:phosphoribosylformylglycinamidine cyclo-ligase